VTPVERAPTVGVNRIWPDMGYVAGGLLVGDVADAIDFSGAIALVACLTAVSGLIVARDLPGPSGSPGKTLAVRRARA
jgi:hypothetical protein